MLGIFSNTDKANFEIDGLEINTQYYKAKNNRYIKKFECFKFELNITLTKIPEYITLILHDDCDQKYKYNLYCEARNDTDIEIVRIEPCK